MGKLWANPGRDPHTTVWLSKARQCLPVAALTMNYTDLRHQQFAQLKQILFPCWFYGISEWLELLGMWSSPFFPQAQHAPTSIPADEETSDNISRVRRKQHQTSKTSRCSHPGFIPWERWIKTITVSVFILIFRSLKSIEGVHSVVAIMWICSPAFPAAVSACTVSITGWLRTVPAASRKG